MMFDLALHRWIEANADKLVPAISAKIRVNFPRDTLGTPTTNYVETAAEIRRWVNQSYPDTLGWEYDL
jgi:hypothetical protein